MTQTHHDGAGWFYRLTFPRWRPRAELRPRGRSADGALARVRWLGTAGHVIETAGATLLVDPFLTRTPARRMLAPLQPDPTAIFARVPRRVDAILCGHSHYDHLLDTPTIALATGALVVGSRSTCLVARAAGVPEAQLREIPPGGGSVTVGDATVRFVPSLHGKALLGRVPFPGELGAPPSLPLPLWGYRMGGAYGIHVSAGGLAIYHNGSADLIDAALAGLRADVLLVGLAGRRGTPGYLARLCETLAPSLVVPTHHDAFFGPMDGGVRLLPGIDLDGFVAEARRRAPGARVVTPDYDEVLAIPARAGEAALLERS